MFDFSEFVCFAACFLKVTMEINATILEYDIKILEESVCTADGSGRRSRRWRSGRSIDRLENIKHLKTIEHDAERIVCRTTCGFCYALLVM